MKVIGLCKSLSCSEYLPVILPILYKYLDAIVFVNSDTNWLGEKVNGDVFPFVNLWKKGQDKDNKIVNLMMSTDNQIDQYNFGYDFIRKNYDVDWVFIFDTDEIWEEHVLKTLFEVADEDIEHNAISTRLYTYVKSPFYRVEPPEPLMPCVMFRPIFPFVQGIRGNKSLPMMTLPNLYFHHFSYVRKEEKELFKKIYTSTEGDKGIIDNLTTVNMDNWKSQKWDKLPDAKNFHTSRGFENCWESIKVIEEHDLPKGITDLYFIQKYLGEPNE